MMILRRRGVAALAILLCLTMLATGCRRRRRGGNTTITKSSDIFTTDSFPGSPVQNGNVADDKRAMSNSGETFQDGFKMTFNGDRNAAMVTYNAGDAFYAHYYDGETWTPPVFLGAIDAQLNSGVDGRQVVHAFVNTENHTDSAARARNGDCLIFWSALDTDDDGGATADDVNGVLFATYFDASYYNVPGRRYGFQEFAVRVSVSQDEDSEDVLTFGVASDGLIGEANWGPNRNAYEWGDPTTSIVAFWNQLENNDGDTSPEDVATYFAWFNLAQAGDEDLPLLPAADVRISTVNFGALDTGVESHETKVDDRYVTYNNVLFMRCGADENAGGDDGVTGRIRFNRNYFNDTIQLDDDITLQVTSFDLTDGDRSPTLSLHDTDPDATDATENSAEFIREDGGFFRGRHVFGSDEGLACLVFPFVQLIQDPNGDFSDIANDGRLTIAEIDEATGTILADAHLDLEQGGASDTVEEGAVDLRLSRNGDYIWFAWREVSETGGSFENALWTAQFLTTRPDEDGLFALPSLGDALSGTVQVNADVDGEPVTWFAFQAGLTYVCGSQSDPDVMNLFYQQSDAANDEVFVVRLEADLIAAPVGPTRTTSSLEVFEDFVQSFIGDAINDEGFHFHATDSGEGGNFVAFYVEDIDPIGTDLRLFAERTGIGAGTAEIDSAVDFRQMSFGSRVRVTNTPKGDRIGSFDPVTLEDSPDRPHPAELVHVFFEETESTETNGMGFALRTRRFRGSDDSTVLGDTFVPPAGTDFQPPFDLDLPLQDPTTASDADFIGVETLETTVGVWFSELGHLYYQEFNIANDRSDDIGWSQIDGESNPFLIDDDTDIEVSSFVALRRRSGVCDQLELGAIFWTKVLDDNNGNPRLQVRVRDGGVD